MDTKQQQNTTVKSAEVEDIAPSGSTAEKKEGKGYSRFIRRVKKTTRKGVKKLAKTGKDWLEDKRDVIKNMTSKNTVPQADKLRCMPNPDIKFIQGGTTLMLVGPAPGDLHPRRYWLNQFQDRLYYTPDYGEEFSVDDSSIRPDYIDIMEITEIRPGWRTDHFLEVARYQQEAFGPNAFLRRDQCFSIHCGPDRIHSLQAPDVQTALRWMEALHILVNDAQVELRKSQFDPSFWIRHFYRKEVEAHPGGLPLKQCADLLVKLNVRVEPGKVRDCFKKANTNKEPVRGRQVLDEDEFVAFFHLISHRPALDGLFSEISQGEPTISAEKLRKFLVDVQGMSGIDEAKAESLIQQFGCDQLPGFRAFITSDLFDIRREDHRKINQDMTRPLAHYWIKTSHNTYLTKDQLVGPSSIEGYIGAQDCASVELDLWDGPNGQPIIKHGGTLVTTILARDVLEYGIKPYAFLRDDYPIILSIEDHLSDAQRKVFIQDFERIMGSHVYKVENDSKYQSASPEELKRKIIIKANRSKFGALANVCQTMKYPTKDPVPCVSSLSENKLSALIEPSFCERFFTDCWSGDAVKARREEFTRRTQVQLIRVYPSWSRQLSGNFDPIGYMNAGCQMAALNMQTRGEELALYVGRFRANGDCAYALKPEFLIDPAAPRSPPKRLTIKVISAQQLPKLSNTQSSYINPFALIKVVGADEDRSMKMTRIVFGNGLNPVWEQELSFKVQVPELAVILFAVNHYECFSGVTIGSFALPVLSLGQGYRNIPLQDKRQTAVPLATLFVHVKMEDIV